MWAYSIFKHSYYERRKIFMGLFSENKCTRCDRRYSGLRGKCPYCGARKSKRSKKTVDNDKVGWKLVVGIVIMVILILAVVAILFISLNGTDSGDKTSDNTVEETTNNDASSTLEDEGVTSITKDEDNTSDTDNNDTTNSNTQSDNGNTDTETQETDNSNESSTETAAVKSITITYLGAAVNDVTLKVGEVLALEYITDPADVETTAKWACEDTSIATVSENGELTAITSGNTTLTVTIGDVTAECIVRVS
jgi:predicted  nucleic acid-binding Zn-ribbon protein